MTDREPIAYKVHDTLTGDVAYVRAHNRNAARNFHVVNRFNVTPLSVKEALTLQPDDIKDAVS
jgi:hypothetical protein